MTQEEGDLMTQEEGDGWRDVENRLNVELANLIEKYGLKVAVTGLVCAAAGLVAGIDRNPLARALAAWQRTFSMAYDNALFHPVPVPRPEEGYDA
ncbi:MAG: hypothetical protein ACREDH_15615 [Methylocella sp.]